MKKLLTLLVVAMSHLAAENETILLLIRHGESEWNAAGLVQGQSNISLSDRGKEQAKSLADKIVIMHPDIAAIYSSDLDRAYHTAQETANKLDLAIEKTNLLREINMGVAEGLTMEERNSRYASAGKELDQRYPQRQERWRHTHIPGAETYQQITQRANQALIAAATAHPGKKIAIFTHGRLMKTLIMDILDSTQDFPCENCAVAYFAYNPDSLEKPLRFIKIEEPLKETAALPAE